MIFRRLPRLAALLLLPAVALAGAVPSVPPAPWLLDEVKILSAPDMEGRAAGTAGADRAARHIARVFQDAGLRPCCGPDGYLQTFEVVTGTRLGAPNSLALLAPAPRAFALGTDFTPLTVSSDGASEGDVVFVGYGITASNLHYDDYAGLDVRGKIVLAMTGDPGGADPRSPFRRPDAYHYAERSHKIINAREHGARAILLAPQPAGREGLPALSGITHPWGIQAVFLTRAAADALLAPSGKTLATLQERIDRTLGGQSFVLPGVRVKLEVTLVRERGRTANVVGILPGTDPRLRDESLVIGAHYDHLGRGGEGSLAPDEIGTIHPGADDNASGTTGVMALARAFAAQGGLPRTLVFVGFGAEELGILGSSHYVQHPALPLDKTVLMLNMDMIGRLRDNRLYVFGVDSGTGLRDLVTDAARGLPLTLQLRGDPYSPSDHTSFYVHERPILFLFTGAHGDYHRPSDTWEKINPQGMETVLQLAARLVERVASASPPPAYVKLATPASGRGSGGGYGPFFGVIPDFSESERPGVRLGGVRPASPADKAGVKTGDIIIRFAGVDVKTLEDLTFALRSRRSGDTVEVILLRDGKEITTEATLGDRR